MALPFLPGNRFSDPTRTSYARTHTLTYKNGYSIPVSGEGAAAGAAGALTDVELAAYAGADPELTYGARTRRETVPQFVPAYVALDRLVLRFGGYFKESVYESAAESYRVRRVQIQYHLEDDSIAMTEKQQPNSGLPQGTLLKRQLIPRADGSGNVGVADLNVGAEVALYGRTVRITTCDAFTRKYLADQGIAVPDDEPQPRNPYDDRRVALETYTRAHTTDLSQDALLRFLKDDGKVLRFFAVWDDRDRISKQLRPFSVHYFLADDTVEVRELHSPNDGTDQFPLLLHRNPLPKVFSGLQAPGESPSDVYTAEDLWIGMTLNVFGRQMLIHDCDGFTRAWYAENLGREMHALELAPPAPAAVPRVPPPYNGFGTEEDSLGSVNCLEPKPPRRDFVKLMKNDGKVLRFEANLVSTSALDKGRKFIVAYYLADDTVSVFEPPQRNSGIEGGKILERRPAFYSGSMRKLQVTDFYVGATVTVNASKYLFTDADEYALCYMEAHCDIFTKSDLVAVRGGLARFAAKQGIDLGAAFRAAAATATVADGCLSPDEFQDALLAVGADLTGQEVLTLMRGYDVARNGRIQYATLLADVAGKSGGSGVVAAAPATVRFAPREIPARR